MPSLSTTKTVTNGGTSFQQAPLTLTGTNLNTIGPVTTIAVAKAGTLSVRGSGTAGTLAMAPGHGFTNGQRLDIYWTGGSCRGATIGTVATNDIPFTLATGDALPVITTVIAAMVPISYSAVITGNNMALACAALPNSVARATFVFATVTPTEVKGVVVNPNLNTAGDAWSWSSSDSTTNPFASASITQIYMSHDSITAAQSPVATVLFS